jgi:5-epi-alpha-selinene synthase
MSDCVIWFTLFDDECESAASNKQLEWLTSEHARLIDILKGVELTNSDTPLARALRNIQQRLLQHGTSEWMLGFTEEVAKFFKGQFREALNYSQGITPDLPTYIQIRSLTGGMFIFFKITFLVERIDLPTEVVKHTLVKQIERVANKVASFANDILSYEKEIKEGCTHNLVHVIQQEYQIPVQEAIERAASLHDAEVCSFIELLAQLPSFGAEIDGNLERYISSLQFWMRGNLDWSVKAERYQRSCLSVHATKPIK